MDSLRDSPYYTAHLALRVGLLCKHIDMLKLTLVVERTWYYLVTEHTMVLLVMQADDITGGHNAPDQADARQEVVTCSYQPHI